MNVLYILYFLLLVVIFFRSLNGISLGKLAAIFAISEQALSNHVIMEKILLYLYSCHYKQSKYLLGFGLLSYFESSAFFILEKDKQ